MTQALTDAREADQRRADETEETRAAALARDDETRQLLQRLLDAPRPAEAGSAAAALRGQLQDLMAQQELLKKKHDAQQQMQHSTADELWVAQRALALASAHAARGGAPPPAGPSSAPNAWARRVALAPPRAFTSSPLSRPLSNINATLLGSRLCVTPESGRPEHADPIITRARGPAIDELDREAALRRERALDLMVFGVLSAHGGMESDLVALLGSVVSSATRTVHVTRFGAGQHAP